MCLDMLFQVVLGGELSLTLLTLGWLGVFTEVFGQPGRGEELPLTLSAGEPLCVEVDLLVSPQGPSFVEEPPALLTHVVSLHFSRSWISGLNSSLGKEMAVQDLEQTHHVLLSQFHIFGFVLKFGFCPIINNFLNGILLVKSFHYTSNA